MRANTAVLLAALVAGCGGAAPASRSVDRPAFERMLAGLVRGPDALTGAVALVRDPTGTWRGAAGLADVRRGTPMQPDTRFRIGSVTKTFVAALTLRLAGEGTLMLDAPVRTWLPSLDERITVRHLLNHTSGLVEDPRIRIAGVLPRRAVAEAAAGPPAFTPGATYVYASTNYLALGLILEAVTGRPLGTELRDRIFQRLGLHQTSFEPGAVIHGPHARGYVASGGLQPVYITAQGGGSWAAGAIVSTVDDLARFFGALLGGELLEHPQLGDMKQAIPVSGGGAGLGIGWLRLNCGEVWTASGLTAGYVTFVNVSEDGSRVVVFAGTGVGWNVASAAALRAIADAMYCRA